MDNERQKITRFSRSGILLTCSIIFGIWILGCFVRSRPVEKPFPSTNTIPAEEIYLLELGDWNLTKPSSTRMAQVNGQVKNISNQDLRSVEVVVSFFDDKGIFMSASSYLIDYNPILSGQTSPFLAFGP